MLLLVFPPFTSVRCTLTTLLPRGMNVWVPMRLL